MQSNNEINKLADASIANIIPGCIARIMYKGEPQSVKVLMIKRGKNSDMVLARSNDGRVIMAPMFKFKFVQYSANKVTYTAEGDKIRITRGSRNAESV